MTTRDASMVADATEKLLDDIEKHATIVAFLDQTSMSVSMVALSLPWVR